MKREDWFKKIQRAKKIDKFQFIIDCSKDKSVMDVGCVGQDKGFDSPNWLHGRIKKVASECIGVDIDESGVEQLKKDGFNVILDNELNGHEKIYDLIIMGDVIEHVSNPLVFINQYAPFLKPGGKMIICTPNGFGIRYFIQILFYGKSSTNPEHTFAFEPITFVELVSRSELKIDEFYWLKEYRKGSNFQQKVILGLSSVMIFFRSYFNSNFMFTLKK